MGGIIFSTAAAQSVSSGASREVKGTVLDGSEYPLVGVAVLVEGTTNVVSPILMEISLSKYQQAM